MAGPFKSEESNFSVTYNSVDVTAYFNQADIEALVREIESTNLASVNGESSPGSIDWNLKGGGLLEKTSDDTFGKDSVTPPSTLRALVVTLGPSGTRTTFTWSASTTEGAFVDSYSIQPTDSVTLIPFQVNIGISGGPVRS